MPQMSCMFWLLLVLFFVLIYLLLAMVVYFMVEAMRHSLVACDLGCFSLLF